MRRISIFLAVFSIFAIILIPSLAQTTTIASLVENESGEDDKYHILQHFLEVAPDIQEALDNAGSFTLLAPNNTAFENLSDELELTLDDLLSNEELVTTILYFHILDIRLSATRLSTLEDSEIQVEVGDDGELILNETGGIITTEPFASNGIVHEISAVLLNDSIRNLLEEQFATATPTTSATALPSPTEAPSPTNTPTPTATESTSTTTQSISTANVRFAHFALNAPDFDVMISSDIPIEEDAGTGTVTDFMSVPPGIYTATATGLDGDDEIALDVDLILLDGDFVTIILIDSDTDNAVELVALTENFENLSESRARIVLYHALDNAPAISLLPEDPFDIGGVRFGEIESNDIIPGDYDISLVEARDNDELLAEAEQQRFVASAFYFIAIYGDEASPELVILETTMDDILGLGASPTATVEASGSDEREGTIFEVLQADENFSFLVNAIEAAHPRIERQLRNMDSDELTLLAPNNTAFDNLLITIRYDSTRLLRSTALLNDILEYHIIPEQGLLENDFLDISGTSLVTQLQPAQAIFIRAGNDGSIILNGSVEFEQTDIQASNGIIQEVDDVLLPQSALEALGL